MAYFSAYGKDEIIEYVNTVLTLIVYDTLNSAIIAKMYIRHGIL